MSLSYALWLVTAVPAIAPAFGPTDAAPDEAQATAAAPGGATARTQGSAPPPPQPQPQPAAAVPTPAPQAPAPAPAGDDIVVTGRARDPADPLAPVNAKSFQVTQQVDDAVVAPVTDAYTKIFPKPVRHGLRNFLSNLREPVVFLNYLLQAKPGKAAETLGRFVINSTIGVAGLFDVAKSPAINLPYRPNGFANTLGFYGMKPGPFVFLPIIGATTPRDFIGTVLDRLVVPLGVGQPFNQPAYSIPTSVVDTLDQRIALDAELAQARSAPDPYRARRELYLSKRQAEIDQLHGRRVKTLAGEPAPALVPAPGG